MATERTSRTPKNARTNRNADWTARWLEAFRETGLVTEACKLAEVGRSTVYQRRDADEDFAAAWQQVEDETTEEMERAAYQRGVHGIRSKVFYNDEGEEVGYEQKYSDTLLIFMLKARRPHVYRENVKMEHTGPGGGPIEVADERLDLRALSDEDIAVLREINARAAERR